MIGSRWNSYLPTWLHGSRGILLGVAALAIGGAALGWPWLVALGIAPILLSLAPCALMCAFGVCAMCKGSKSTASQDTKTDAVISTTAPLLVTDQLEPARAPAAVPERAHAMLS